MPMSPYYRALRAKIGSMPIFSPSVAAVIRNDRGDVLFQKPRGSTNVWSLPAGAIELGETPAMAVVREVYEETGLRVEPVSILAVLGGDAWHFTYPDGNQVEYVVVVFACRVLSGDLGCLDGESEELRYFDPENRPLLALPYPDDVFRVTDAPTWFQGT